jgi:alpha-glucosidase
LTVQRQDPDPESTLNFFRSALRSRREQPEFDGTVLEELTADADVLTVRTSGGLTCVLNAGADPVPLPAGRVLLASAALEDGRLPADAAAWIV